MKICPKCGSCFKSLQGYSKHYQLCYLAKQSSSERNNRKRKLHNENEFLMPSSEILLNPTLQHQNYDEDHTNSNDTLSPMEQSTNNNHLSTSTRTAGTCNYSPSQITHEPMILNSEQKSLLDQESKYQKRVAPSKLLWSNNDLAKLDLLKILHRHNCHNSAYKDMLKWHVHYHSLHLVSPTSEFKSNDYNRDKFISTLENRFDMTHMRPTIQQVKITETESIKVSVFDFKQQLLSILRDKDLMHPSNLVVDKMVSVANGYKSPLISDIQDGEWYLCALKHYNDLYGVDPDRLVCGVILTMDKTHTDWKGKLCLEPVQFTLSIFNKDVRKRNSKCWRCLGYINDMDGYDIKKLYTSITETKSIIYHQILTIILKSMKQVQDVGLGWNIEFPSGQKRLMKLYFPICLCVVDMKGAKQLCAMFDTTSAGVKRRCVSCNANQFDLDDESFVCEPVIQTEMQNMILDPSSNLSLVSQHRNPFNAFFDMNLGGWEYGIWGLCPSEILHQFHEGVVGYVLQEFLDKKFLNDAHEVGLIKGVGQIIEACKNLGCYDEYPSGTFSMGITKYSTMKGNEKFGSLFYLCLFLHTELVESRNFEGEQLLTIDMKRNNKVYSALAGWRSLFEQCIYYHDWTMKQSFLREDLPLVKQSIRRIHGDLKKLVKRDGKGIKNIPKMHEFFHVTRNIVWHGPPICYDTRPAESNLKVHKHMAQNTQRQIASFCHQTAKRLHEGVVVRQSSSQVQKISKKMLHNNIFQKRVPESRDTVEQPSTRRHIFYAILNNEDLNVNFFKDKTGKQPITNTQHFDRNVKAFLNEHVFSLLEDPVKHNCIECCGNIIRKGISFRGYSTDVTKYPGWAMIQWIGTQCPAQILFFMNLKGLVFKCEHQNQYQLPCQYAVIRSLNRTPIPINQGLRNPICGKGYFENVRHKYRIVSERTFVHACFVIPNFGQGKTKEDVLYIFPRNKSTHTPDNGWSSKF